MRSSEKEAVLPIRRIDGGAARLDFSRNCDELFGVDHNKQLAIRFTQAAKLLAQDDRPTQVILDEVGVEEDDIHRIVADHSHRNSRYDACNKSDV